MPNIDYYQQNKPKGMVSSRTVGSDVATGGVLADRVNRTPRQLDPRVYAPYKTAAQNLGDMGNLGTSQYGDVNPMDVFTALGEWPVVGSTQDTGGGGGGYYGGGGSGGGGGGASPQMSAAYRQYLADLQGGVNPYTGAADRFKTDTSYLDQIYNDANVNARYDRFGADVGRAGEDNRSRVAQIAADLDARNAQAAGNVAQGFDARQSAIADLAREFAAAQQGEVGSLNSVLNSFDAGTVAAEAAPLNNLFQASQATVGDTANLFAQSAADRANIGRSLAADVEFGSGQAQQALEAYIANRRGDALQANAGARAQGVTQAEATDADRAFQLWLQEQAYNQAQADKLAQARLQAAELGIEV